MHASDTASAMETLSHALIPEMERSWLSSQEDPMSLFFMSKWLCPVQVQGHEQGCLMLDFLPADPEVTPAATISALTGQAVQGVCTLQGELGAL